MVSILAIAVAGATTGCLIIPDDNETTDGGTTDPGDACGGVPVSGECVGNKIRSCFVSEEFDQDPRVVEVDCGANEKCVMGVNGAQCEPTGDCYEGTSQCKNANTLQICENGAWVDTDCGTDACASKPGTGAVCISNEGSTGITLKGHLDYQYLLPNKELTDFDPAPVTEGAVDMFVTVYDNNTGEMLGMALTSVGTDGKSPGDWEMELSKAVSEDTYLFFWPMLFDDNGNPRMAIAKAESSDAFHQKSTEYWYFGFEICAKGSGECGATDLGTQLIRIEDHSGVVNIYQWLDYGIFRFEGLYPNVKPLSFGVFHAPTNDFDCGNCFISPQGGGAYVTYDKEKDLTDHFDTSMCISGTPSNPTMWAKSVINHEFGHWAMATYTKSPHEGGPHYVNAASKPGLSYSEGYATFTGQSQISKGPSDNDPIYFTKKKGTTFWVDVSKNTYSGGALQMPDPNGPIDQYVNENVITSMFWSFWASANAVKPQSLGEAPVFSTFRSQRLLGGQNRGYKTVDFIDYLDAMTCENTATTAQIDAVTSSVGYPWDNQPICP